MKKIRLYIIMIVILALSGLSVSANNQKIITTENSESQRQEIYIEIPGLVSLDGISVDDGMLGYEVLGNTIKVTVDNGNADSVVYDRYDKSAYYSTYILRNTLDGFDESVNVTSGEYSGHLFKLNEPILVNEPLSIYKQYYDGYLYKEGFDSYYSYSITLNYTDDLTPPDRAHIKVFGDDSGVYVRLYSEGAYRIDYSLQGVWINYDSPIKIESGKTLNVRGIDQEGNVSEDVSFDTDMILNVHSQAIIAEKAIKLAEDNLLKDSIVMAITEVNRVDKIHESKGNLRIRALTLKNNYNSGAGANYKEVVLYKANYYLNQMENFSTVYYSEMADMYINMIDEDYGSEKKLLVQRYEKNYELLNRSLNMYDIKQAEKYLELAEIYETDELINKAELLINNISNNVNYKKYLIDRLNDLER